MIHKIDIKDLPNLDEKEGLVLQGCGEPLQEWFDGINNLLTEQGILLDGSRFEKCYSFKNENCTCLLFPFNGQQMNMGRFAIWRIGTHETLGGTWLSDFIDHHQEQIQGTVQNEKPDCPLIGADGNIFNLMGIASRTLRTHGMQKQAEEMTERIYQSGSYPEALNIIGEYVNITSVDDEIDEAEEGVMGLR